MNVSDGKRFPAKVAYQVFMSQFRHTLYNPQGLIYSENCGPTSLAMVASVLGVKIPPIPGCAEPREPQSLIDAARFWMFSTSDGKTVNAKKDGVEFTPNGVKRAPREHLTLINLPDLERGAENLSLVSRRLRSWSAIDNLLASGQPVVLAGDPSLPGAYGPRLKLDYTGGHIVLVLEHRDDLYLVNDPLLDIGPCWIPFIELEAFVRSAPFEDCLALAFSFT